MKHSAHLLLLALGLCIFAVPAQARHHRTSALKPPPPEPPPLQTEAVPKISPDAPPSESLQSFLNSHLAKVLTPLGVAAFAQPELVEALKAAYADAAAAAPESHRPALQYAQAVCEALANAMEERQSAVNALHGSLATRSDEAAQPRGGRREVRTKTRLDNAFFVTSQQDHWNARAEASAPPHHRALPARTRRRAAGWPMERAAADPHGHHRRHVALGRAPIQDTRAGCPGDGHARSAECAGRHARYDCRPLALAR